MADESLEGAQGDSSETNLPPARVEVPGAVKLDAGEGAPYPEHWEADVVLRDGGICHIRPISPDDAQRLRDFHSKLSAETIYFRYFAPYPELSDRDVKRFTEVDHNNRVALVATVGDEIVGVGRYDRTSDTEAEVAFTVRDDNQGRGLGSVLLEHLAEAARERGVQRFIADVLPVNRKMLGTFAMAGYDVAQELDEGVARLAFNIEPTEALMQVARSREKRAESRSIARLFQPESVAVVGASQRKDSLGNQMLRALASGGFTGRLVAVHRTADSVAGVPAYRTLAEAPGPLDLVVVAVPADAVERVIDDAAAAGVHGLLVLSAGYAEIGPEGAERQRRLVHEVRSRGMRLIGPNALGVINTDTRVRLSAALVKETPFRGGIGVFCQSAAIGGVLIDEFRQRGLGLSSFISVGNRADVSSADSLQYWSDDPATRVVALYIDAIANPRKLIRVARDVARHMPVVALRAGRVSQAYPLGQTVRRTTLPPSGVDQIFQQAGVIEVASLERMLDVCGLLSCQPLPRGGRVAIISDSVDLAAVAEDTCGAMDLVAAGRHVLNDPVEQLPATIADVMADPGVDAILVVNVPPGVENPPDLAPTLLAASKASTVPIVAVLAAEDRSRVIAVPGPDGGAGRGSVPVFGTIEDALQTLSLTVGYSRWRETPRGDVPELPDVDTEGARSITDRALARQRTRPGPQRQTIRLSAPATTKLLERYGITVWPALPVATEDEAVAAADSVGWPAVLKTVDPRLARRMEMGGVRLNLESEAALRAAYLSMSAQLDAESMSQVVVQRMAPSGVSCVVSSREDPLFGPIVGFRVGGVLTELLADKAYRVPPISDLDAARLVRAPQASRLLFGFGGNPPVDCGPIEQLIIRVGRMAEDLPSLVQVNLDPVVASPRGSAVLGAQVWLRVADARVDTGARRLADV